MVKLEVSPEVKLKVSPKVRLEIRNQVRSLRSGVRAQKSEVRS